MSRRNAIVAPVFDALPLALQEKVFAEGRALAALEPVDPTSVLGAATSLFGDLADPLSPAIDSLSPGPETLPRSHREQEALNRLQAEGGLKADARGFPECLVRLNRWVSPERNGWRRDEICLTPDRLGRSILFPTIEARPAQMEKLRLTLVDRSTPAIFRGAVALALLSNCHPFTDGNGRSARVLFNLALRTGGMPASVYIPLYEIARRSRGGYEISLRRAELQGDWGALMVYFLKAIDLHRRVSAGA